MKKRLACVLAPLSLFATDYVFVDLDHPWEIDKKYPWHFEVDGRKVASANFEDLKHSKLHYADAHAFGYYSHFWNQKNAVSLQLGYTYMQLDWDKSARGIEQSNFHLGLASVAIVSNALDKWRFILNLGMTVDTTTFDFGHSSVYYTLLWGRYAFLKNVGVHTGFFGFTGVHTTYLLPVIGFDFQINSQWKLNAIFPLDFSLSYNFNSSWEAALSWASFGGPYRYPWRVNGGEGRFRDAVIEVNANGLEVDLNYNYKRNLFAGIGAGWNFGGWILVRDHNGHHGKYYDFNTAPYVQANLAITF